METSTIIEVTNSEGLSSWLNLALTAFAVIAAVYAGKQAKYLLDIETKRELDRDWDTKREQSKLISAWAAPNHTLLPGRSDYLMPGIEVIIQNNSQQPIFEVTVEWWIDGEHEQSSAIDQIPPVQSRTRPISSGLIDKYVGIEGYETSYMWLSQAEGDCQTICDFTRTAITFRDSQNRKWRRGCEGILEEI